MNVEVILAEFNRSPRNVDNLKKYFNTVKFISSASNIFKDHPRWGWRMNDYWKVNLLLKCKEIGISFDGDMIIVSDKVKDIVPLVKKFGICLPANPRYLVGTDASIGADGGAVDIGTGYAVNCGIIAADVNNPRARELIVRFCELMLDKPERGPLVWWRAIWETGIVPYLLPPQWCVCEENIGIGKEIVLHAGHEKVRQYYNISFDSGTVR